MKLEHFIKRVYFYKKPELNIITCHVELVGGVVIVGEHVCRKGETVNDISVAEYAMQEAVISIEDRYKVLVHFDIKDYTPKIMEITMSNTCSKCGNMKVVDKHVKSIRFCSVQNPSAIICFLEMPDGRIIEGDAETTDTESFFDNTTHKRALKNALTKADCILGYAPTVSWPDEYVEYLINKNRGSNMDLPKQGDLLGDLEQDNPQVKSEQQELVIQNLIDEYIQDYMLDDKHYAELRSAGVFDKDSDYGGMLGKSVMRLIAVSSMERHSGMSHSLALSIYNKLQSDGNLTELTNNPDEWYDRSDMSGEPFWQNKRNTKCFSKDGGKTYYNVNDVNTTFASRKENL